MTEQIRKGLSYAAYGFLFVLININLGFNGRSVDIMPDFIGFILFFLAFDLLGSYTAGREYLKWASLLLIVLSGAQWIMNIASPAPEEAGSAASILQSVTTIVAAIYFFIFFGSLEAVARDFHSPREDTIHLLRYFNLIVDIALFAMPLFLTRFVSATVTLTLILGAAALAAAIATAVTLFRLRKDVLDAAAQ